MDDYIKSLLEEVVGWAKGDEMIVGLAVVGSYARGDEREESDLDLMLVVEDKERFLKAREWIELFGVKAQDEVVEDWGLVTSVRVWYEPMRCPKASTSFEIRRDKSPGLLREVEFGFAGLEWMRVPVDEKTARVVRNGIRILYDPEGRLSGMVEWLNEI